MQCERVDLAALSEVLPFESGQRQTGKGLVRVELFESRRICQHVGDDFCIVLVVRLDEQASTGNQCYDPNG